MLASLGGKQAHSDALRPASRRRDPQIIREEAQGVKKNPLLAKRAGERRVNLVNYEHAHIKVAGP
jgi:hypothetical protein